MGPADRLDNRESSRSGSVSSALQSNGVNSTRQGKDDAIYSTCPAACDDCCVQGSTTEGM